MPLFPKESDESPCCEAVREKGAVHVQGQEITNFGSLMPARATPVSESAELGSFTRCGGLQASFWGDENIKWLACTKTHRTAPCKCVT